MLCIELYIYIIISVLHSKSLNTVKMANLQCLINIPDINTAWNSGIDKCLMLRGSIFTTQILKLRSLCSVIFA